MSFDYVESKPIEYSGGMLIKHSPVRSDAISSTEAKNGDIVTVESVPFLGTGRIIKVYQPNWQNNQMVMVAFGRSWLVAPLSACNPINVKIEKQKKCQVKQITNL